MPQIFANPAVLLAFYDPLFWSGGDYHLYEWQKRILGSFADKLPNKPKHIAVAAAVGSGKSSMLIAPAANWTSLFQKALSVITSASGAQLDMQSMRAVKNLAQNVNAYHQSELFDIQYRHLEFNPTGAYIEARVTDDPNLMEGFHPQTFGAEFSIFVDEAKGITEDMWPAILKWNGYTRRMDVTSPGEQGGTFYNNLVSGRWEAYEIRADDCPHITQEYKDEVIATYGIESPITRAILYAKFTDLSGSLVMTLDTIKRCLDYALEKKLVPHREAAENNCGLDLSGGGDETVMSIWNGNKQLEIESMHFKDTMIAVDEIIRRINKWKLFNPSKRKADAGGLGKPILDALARKGFPFVRVYNQSRPQNDIIGKSYLNRATEGWYRVARLFEECALIPLPDKTQMNQLANRYFKKNVATGKLMVEPKAEARVHGHPSPDRADALILAVEDLPVEQPKQQEKKRKSMSIDELIDHIDRLNDREFQIPDDGNPLLLEDLVGIRKNSEIRERLLW